MNLGLGISEKHVIEISKNLGLEMFKIGSRRALKSGPFKDKFEDFVKLSSAKLNTQTQNRINGATIYNEKMDAIFAYLEYINGKAETFNYANWLAFLKAYDGKKYLNFNQFKVQNFIVSRGLRKEGSNRSIRKVILVASKAVVACDYVAVSQ